MTFRQKQSVFAELVGRLLTKAYQMGFEVTLGEAYRPPETAELYAKQGRGISNSNHCKKLAIDLNVFKDGRYLRRSDEIEPLGEWWERQSFTHSSGRKVECCWGGRFDDGGHFSLKHGTVR